LLCVLPGAARRGVRSNQIHIEIEKHNLKIDLVGMLSRSKMNEVYNKSRLFVYLGYGGQNDRGPLEALRCGTPILIASYKRHAFFFRKNNKVVKITGDSEDFNNVAIEIYNCLHGEGNLTREETANFFEENSGVETVILPEMKGLFFLLKMIKPNNSFLLQEELKK